MSHGHTGPSGAVIFSPTQPVNGHNPVCRDMACLFYRWECARHANGPSADEAEPTNPLCVCGLTRLQHGVDGKKGCGAFRKQAQCEQACAQGQPCSCDLSARGGQ